MSTHCGCRIASKPAVVAIQALTVDQAAKAMKDAEMEAEIEDFLEGFKQPTYRGMRVNGVRVPVWSSQHGWSGL
jgi:hypothetical protein